MRKALRWTVAAVLVLHGLIHLLGVFKGFGWAEVARLEEPIGPTGAVAWLVAAVVVVAAAVMLALSVRGWWAAALAAAAVSQVVILTRWDEANVGTAANLLLLLATAYGIAVELRRRREADARGAQLA